MSEIFLKAPETASLQKDVLPTVRNNFVVVLNEEHNGDLGLTIVERRQYFQETADFEASFRITGAAPREAVADLEGQVNNSALDTKDLGLVGQGGQSDEMD